MSAISGDWLEALKGEFHQPYYAKLYKTVMTEYQTRKIFPPADDLFNAFHFTPLNEVKVVILGQDPYHNDGQAHGLCFSVKRGVETPPSLVNIYQELHDDCGCYIPNNGYLEKWAKPVSYTHLRNKNRICQEAFYIWACLVLWTAILIIFLSYVHKSYINLCYSNHMKDKICC